MKIKYQLVSVAFMGIMSAGVLLSYASATKAGSCYLSAKSKDVYVIVYDLDRQGNQGSPIWQGRIAKGQQALVRTPHGRFRYNYTYEPDRNQPLSVGSDRWCNSGKTVGVP